METSTAAMENNMENSQKIKNKPPYDPAIPFLATYLKNMQTLIQKDICTPMFIAELFIKPGYGE